jgi:diketogulonate reductase-like aldo/keto reductase
MAQINNIKSKIQLKEELLTQRESSLDHKLNQIYQKEEELKKNQDEYNIKKTLLDQREIEISKKEKKVEEMLEYLENQQNPNLFNKMMNFGLNHVLPAKKKLKYGIEIPYVGMGTSRIQNVEEAIYNSIKNGIRLIDTAVKYGNEEQVGKGIKKALDEGICKREDLFIIGKIWLEEKEHPEEAIRGTLNRLQLDYLDLYLDHWPCGIKYDELSGEKKKHPSIFEFWPKMESLVEEGITRGIGCSNYNVQSLLNLLSFCRIRPLVNEVELHPYYYQENLKKFCDKENIALIAYYPLAHGNGARVYISEHNGQMNSFEEKNVVSLAEKYNKTPGQIILNWEVAQGIITIPGSSQFDRAKENLGALDFKMSDEEIKMMNVYGKKMKFCGCRRFFGMNIMA